MKLLTWDSAAGAAFVVLGASVISAGRTFPVGAGGVPGPGFFPVLVGSALVMLGLALIVQGAGRTTSYWDKRWTEPAVRRTLLVPILLAAYVWVWESIEFLARTPLLLLAIYRVLGEPWLRSAILAAAITAALYGTFQGLFDLRL